MTLELHLNILVQPVSELQATERGSGGFGSTDTPKGTISPSLGKPLPPFQEEGAQFSPVSSSTLTLLSPPHAPECVLLVCTYIPLWVAAHRAGIIQASSEAADQGSAVNQALGLMQGIIRSLLLAYSDSIRGHNHVDSVSSGDLLGTEPFPPVSTDKTKALVPV